MKVRVREEIAAALLRAARELRMAAGMIEDLEHVVGKTISRHDVVGADAMVELQGLDHVGQSLLGVADFLEEVGESASPEWTVDVAAAARCVLLADLAGRLGGSVTASEPVAVPESYELF